MHRSPAALRHLPARHVLATAAALALGCCATAWAQTTYYTRVGNVSAFPVDPTTAAFDALGPLYVGSDSPGSFSALAGAQFTATALSIANGGISVQTEPPGGSWGSVTFDGAGTTATLTGTQNRLEVGNWGTGTMIVSGGAVVDATAIRDACTDGNCYNVIGNAAGSTGTLTITGASSELRTLRAFTVGSAYVATGFGTLAGTTNSYLNVLAGGTLRTEGASLALGPDGPGASGSERSFAEVVVDGANSRWFVTHNSIDGWGAFVNAGFANSQATITVRNGGQLIVDGSAGPDPYNNITLGTDGGRGDMVVESGGKVVLIGGAASGRIATFSVGGYGTGSRGYSTVTGTGSEIVVTGAHARVNVGDSGATGQLDVLNLGRVTSGGLYIGNKGGVGTVNVGGGFIDLNGPDGRLIIGNSGVGTLAVSGGGVVDATLNPDVCTGNWCGNVLANGAGSTGTLTIDGAGSEVRMLRNFSAASAYADEYTGTPGGNATATINIFNGGSLRTQQAIVASGPSGPLALGTEKSFATVVINGAGSQWIVTPNTVDSGGISFMSLASHANATADVTISGGGLLRIDGRIGSAGPNDGINVGGFGKATLTVTGSGSHLETLGVNPFINVGGQGGGLSAADSTLNILDGATASTLYLNVGRNGAAGKLVIDGADSTLTQSGVGSGQLPGANGPAFAHIGRNSLGAGGTGSATVSSGGQWLISDAGLDGRASESGPGIALGRGADSSGTLTITGAGSRVEINSTSLGLAPGVADNYNPFFAVGYDNHSTTLGTLTIGDGGKLVMNGNAVSTAANPRATQLAIGGRGDNLPANGIATVTGQNSEILVTGSDALISVGRGPGGDGTLTVLDGGKVTGTLMLVGSFTTGTVNIDDARIELGGQMNSPTVGATLAVGRGNGGFGLLNMSNGAAVSITPTNLSGLLTVGGDSLAQGGTGIVTLSGRSSITFAGTVSGNNVNVGRYGMGTLTLSGSSSVDAGTTGTADFGRLSTGSGHLVLQSGSVFSANQIDFGGNSDTSAGGTGTGTVNGLDSELKAAGATAFIGVGRGGSGTLTVTDQGKVTGTVLSVGRSGGEGTLSGNSATINLSGQQTAGSLTGARLSVGTGGGTGTAALDNSTIAVRNLGTDGAAVFIGGSGSFPTGTGLMSLSGGSQLTVTAAAGALSNVTVGRDGTGTLKLTGGSTVNVGSDFGGGFVADGSVFVGRDARGVGRLELSGGSVINAGFVGIGVSAAGTNNTQVAAGGSATLVLNNSTINTSRFELGANGLLTGDGGVINAGVDGPVIIAGTISPGNSPGRIRIRCDITMLAGSQLILDIDDTGVSFDIDQLIIGNTSRFDLLALQIVFNFIGTTNPDEFANSEGGFNLGKFLRAEEGEGETTQDLSTLFQANGNDYESWDDVLNPDNFSAISAYYNVADFRLGPNGEVGFESAAIPEPSSVALALLALLAIATLSRRRRMRQG